MKKILVLAFVSAAFLFSCSADGSFSGSYKPPTWKGMPGAAPSTPGGGSGSKYCILYDYYYDECDCYSMTGHTDDQCYDEGGDLSNSCPSYCYDHTK